MKKTNLVKDIGSKNYLRYSRSKLLNFLNYSRAVNFDVEMLVASKDYKQCDKMLKSKIPSYYAAKHEGFKSLAEYFDGKPIVDLASSISDARRDFKVKPASWFKTGDAHTILNYIRERFEVTRVLDPFHGWGARYLASAMVPMEYVGVDANPLLHFEMKSLCPGAELILGNSFEIDYSGMDFDCVFTCPPYWQCEDYGYRVKNESYEVFLKKMCDLFVLLSNQAIVQVISLENFYVGSKKYGFEEDFTKLMTSSGLVVESFVYSKIARSFNGDQRELKIFLLTKPRA